MLSNGQDINIIGIERILPLVTSDGILHMSSITIDPQFTQQILSFFGQLKMQPIFQRPFILKAVFENVKIEC